MRITEDTVDRAFEAFYRRYVEKKTRAWDLNHHGRLWANARTSVESRNDEGFVQTVEELRSHWQIARGRDSEMMKSEAILPLLRVSAQRAATIRLSALTVVDATWLFQSLCGVSEIKQVKGEPSLMAISKVLHFFNPRLFVIVDRAMVWNWMLTHEWLWRPIEKIRDQIDLTVDCDPSARDDTACDIGSYVAILIGCGELLRDNPHVNRQFAGFLRGHTTAEAQLPADLESYESAAVEWLMLGLVELPPAGVAL